MNLAPEMAKFLIPLRGNEITPTGRLSAQRTPFLIPLRGNENRANENWWRNAAGS